MPPRQAGCVSKSSSSQLKIEEVGMERVEAIAERRRGGWVEAKVEDDELRRLVLV
jgi:hypothetical protein